MNEKNRIRAEILQRKRAFDAVIDLRTDLKRTEQRLAFLTSLGKQCRPEAAILARDHVANLQDKLALAVAYCRKINPDELQAHDAAVAEKEAAERQAQESEQTEAIAVLAANRTLNEAKGRERVEAQMLREIENRELKAEYVAEQAALKATLQENLESRRRIAEERMALRQAALERQASSARL